MKTALKFENASDQKRLVRGEHLLMARSLLRIRDGVHHRPWRVFMLAGGSPEGEIKAIRELMPKAYIVAVDKDAECVARAIDAGADDVVCCDLSDYGNSPAAKGKSPNPAIQELGKFDLVDLDLCAGANKSTRELLSAHRFLTTTQGVQMVTFSFGRDVVEMFASALKELSFDSGSGALLADVPDLLAGRLAYLFSSSKLCTLRAVAAYKGTQMPMCAAVFGGPPTSVPAKFLQVEPGDFELAAVYPDSCSLYDCPSDRILSLRRKFAAIKARISMTSKDETPNDGRLF